MSSLPSIFMLDLSLQSSSGNFNLCARDCLFLRSALFVDKKHYFNQLRKLQNNVLHKTDDRSDLMILILRHSYLSLLCNSTKTYNLYKKSTLSLFHYYFSTYSPSYYRLCYFYFKILTLSNYVARGY